MKGMLTSCCFVLALVAALTGPLWPFPRLMVLSHGPLVRYVKLRVVHAPGMPGTSSLPLTWIKTVSYRSRHASRHVRHGRAVMHVGIANPRWRGKRSRHSRRMRKQQFYVSGKRPIGQGRLSTYEDVMAWTPFPHCRPFVTTIHRSAMDFSDKRPVMQFCDYSLPKGWMICQTYRLFAADLYTP